MRGPNQWSSEEWDLIVARYELLPLGADEERAFFENSRTAFPDMFLSSSVITVSAREQLLRFLVMELQNRAGMPCSYARLKQSTGPGEVIVIFSYRIEAAGLYAAEAAAETAQSLLKGEIAPIDEYVEKMRRLRQRHGTGPTTTYILDEVKKRKIPWQQFESGSLITLGYGCRQKKIRTAVTDATSGLGMEMAGDKDETRRILRAANLPVPRGIIVYSEEELKERLGEIDFPLVVKPLDGNHGRGVTTDIRNTEAACSGFRLARRISRPVIVEEYVKGEDYRFLVIDYKLVAVARRIPAHVTGDGISTIGQLIDEVNADPDRGDTADHVLAKIKVDEVTQRILAERKLTLNTVLPLNEKLVLKDTANISAGGTAVDATEKVHPANRFMAERVARMFHLDICGIDIMASAIDVPITREAGAIIEVNAGPGLRMHSNPQKGTRRDVAGPILDMLFPTAASARIPVVAITGTNGKTTTTRLIAHIAAQAGYKTGFCVSEGIYINGFQVREGDCTGFVSARQVLFDPTIDFAVLECARGGIIRSGLAFGECDVSVVTNIGEDHIGMKDVRSIDDLAKVKNVLPRATRAEGCAVLNADDDKVFAMYEGLSCRKALFSLSPDSERIRSHLSIGGMAAVAEDGELAIYNGIRTPLGKITELPLTLGGKATFMLRNIMAAVLAAAASGIDLQLIRQALLSFAPTPENTPGRMNVFDFGTFRLIVDYAHNADGFREIGKYLGTVESGRKTGVISVAGDRRDEDLRAVGMISATVFDRIIVRDDSDLRGRKPGEGAKLIAEGIRRVNAAVEHSYIAGESLALSKAVKEAAKNELIFVCADKVKDTLRLVEQLKKEYAVAKASLQ